MANSTDPNQTAPLGAVWSGSTLFVLCSLIWLYIFFLLCLVIDGCLAILRPLSHIERWADDNERSCAMDSCFRLKRPPPQAGLEPGTIRSVGQRLTY